MHIKQVTAAVLAIVFAGIQAADAQDDFKSLSWAKLGAAVANQEVSLVLSNGVRLKGTIERVVEDALAVNIHKTSNRRLYAVGQASIPRQEVSEIRIKRIEGPMRAICSAAIGGLGSLAALPWALSEERVNVSGSSRVAAWAGISAGLVAAGYLVGRAVDSKETVITIAPY
jgi:hypothetical protein